MKNRWNLLLAVAALSALLFGCGNAVGEAVETESEKNSTAETGTAPEETPEDLGESTQKEQDLTDLPVYHNGSNFVKVGDCVYYIKVSEEALNRTALYGYFRQNSKNGVDSQLMCYDTATQEEARPVATVPWSDRLAFYRGCFYLSYSDQEYTEKLVEVNPENGEVTFLQNAAIRYVDPDTGRYVIIRYEEDNVVLEVYAGREQIGMSVVESRENVVVSVKLQGDYLVYRLEDGIGDENGNARFDSMYAYCLSSGEKVCLGSVPENPDESFTAWGETDQMEILDNTLYMGIGFYAGTGHFLNSGVVCKADLTKQDSLQVVEPDETPEAYTGIKETFLTAALPRIVMSDYQEYDVKMDYQTNRLMLLELDGQGGLKETVLTEIPELAYDADSKKLLEVAEYADGRVYMVLDQVVYNPEESIGWRDAYTLNEVAFAEINPEDGRLRNMEKTMVLSELPEATEYTVENPSAENFSGVDLTGYVAKPAVISRVSEEPNGIIDEDDWFKENDLRDERFGDNGEYGLSVTCNACGEEPSGYMLHLDDKDTGERKYNIDLTEFYYPVKVTDHPGLQEGWLPEFQYGYVENNILYASMFHRTYAETMPYHAFIIAIDLTDGRLLWKTENLVNNALHFAVLENVIVCGYGFTDEPDYLYQVDKKSGTVLEQIPLKTGPDYIFCRDGLLYVRTYNTNYVFRVEE